MVCTYLIDDEDVVNSGHSAEWPEWEYRIRNYVYECATSKSEGLPDVSARVSYLFYPACVGKPFAAVMTRAAYQAMLPGDVYDTDGTTLLEVATFDPFHLGVTPAPYLTEIKISWPWLGMDGWEDVESALQAFQLLKPSKSLQVTITIHFIDPERDMRRFCTLFKPAHDHIIRGTSKAEFMKLRDAINCGYPPGLPYSLTTSEDCDSELSHYLWAESPEEEEVLWKDLMAKVCRNEGDWIYG